MRVLGTLGCVAFALGIAAVKLSCSAGLQMRGEVAVGDVSASAGISVGGYAAMEEVPVAGGELRLAAPKVMEFEGASREMIAFPLRHTEITAKVGGMMGVYTIEQVFENPFAEPIEAVYVFPLGDDGAISNYTLTIGERTIQGEIHTTKEARTIYEDAKQRGHTAGLVEQIKPNIFMQRVANIAPRETVTITLTFVELLDFKDGQYELAVPLTVGPRYLPSDAPSPRARPDDPSGATPVAAHTAGTIPRAGVTSISYMHRDLGRGLMIDASRASSTVGFTAEIDASVPIVGIASPSHDIVSESIGPTRTRLTLGSATEIPNRDLIVRYTTAGPQTQVGVLTHRTDDEGYFVLSVQPKATYHTGDIAGREVVIVIDRSGSMNGAPLAQAKAVASGILDTLTERDTFNIVAFASGVESMRPDLVAGTSAGKQLGGAYLRRLSSGGGTEMEAGVVSMLTDRPASDRVRIVYFITDGFIGNDDVVVGAAKRLLGTNRIFTVGVGAAPNRSLLDRLARTGRGYASYLTLTESPTGLAQELVAHSAYPYLTDITVDWGGLDVSALSPSPGLAQGLGASTIPDVYAGQPLVISGRYRTPGAATVKVTATTAGRRVTIPVAVQLPERRDFAPVASLWARRQIEAVLADGDTRDVSDEVTALGLRFHLVTEFTSFVAVDRTRVVSDGQPRVVEQPAIIPEGMTVGNPVDRDEPPQQTASRASGRSGGRSSSGGGGWGGGGGSWGSGGPEDAPWGLLVVLASTLGGLWLVVRRCV